MDHIARSFKASLHISHPDIDPAEISQTVGLIPKKTTRAGAQRTAPFTGDPLPGAYEFSHWSHQFEVEGAFDLGPVLEDLVEKLQRHEAFFARIVREDGAVELFCGVFAAGNWDEVLSHSLLGRLAALHIDLRLDVYPSKICKPE